MTADDLFEATYRALARKAWHTNSGRVAELQSLAEELRRTGTWTPERQERGRELAHSIRGSAGTFGQEAVSFAAGELESRLGTSVPAASAGDVAVLVARVADAIGPAPE